MKQKSGGNRELTTFCGLYYMAKVLAGNDVVGDHQTQDGGPRCNGSRLCVLICGHIFDRDFFAGSGGGGGGGGGGTPLK
ncbi:hypothetical protein BLOT_006459 [Blomia tropicalis]|nr:hypothetical protein BLOT_006459 [Blomia tropicalis]